jgi:methyl coenzyme M reductase subunit C-like uncharacterized protein (methanogenesis marker protein 7)
MKLTSMSLTDYQLIDSSINEKSVDKLLTALEEIEICKKEIKNQLKDCFFVDFDSPQHMDACVDLWIKIKYDEYHQEQNYIITLNK